MEGRRYELRERQTTCLMLNYSFTWKDRKLKKMLTECVTLGLVLAQIMNESLVLQNTQRQAETR